MNAYLNQTSCSITELCRWTGVPRSVYYYRPKDGKPGAPPSTHTLTHEGKRVPNEQIVEDIKLIVSREFADWGYEITAAILKRNYLINEKKVYRLMDENNLLLNRHIRTTGKRAFIQFRAQMTSYPMELLSMDIKYIWIAGEQRNYYLLTIIDVFSKKVVHSILKRSIRKKDVIHFLKTIDDKHSIKGVHIRNDNGPQFIANQVKNYLRLSEVQQEFSHPATPQDNCYIEAYHSILDRAVVQRNEFSSYYEAKVTIERFVEEYNHYRPHRSIGMMTPTEKWDQGMTLKSVRPLTECFVEVLSRPNGETGSKPFAPYSLDRTGTNAYLCHTDYNDQELLNSLCKPVQRIGG